MSWKNTADRYGPVSIGLHWLMFLLIVAVYACMELREFYPRGSDMRDGLKQWHYMLGLSVLLLVVVRLATRLVQTYPRIVPQPSAWQGNLSKVVHFLLYLFMLGMPVAGWLILSAEGDDIPFFGLSLPALIGKSKDVAEAVEEVHETVGNIGYFLIGLHAFAALFHHYFLRDNTLTRILPTVKSKPRGE